MSAQTANATTCFAAGACAALALTGCGTAHPPPPAITSQDQAGTVLVTPVMVAPWADISTFLKPGFTMTGDTAVTEVVPTTEGIQQEKLKATSGSLAIGLPQPSATGANSPGTAPTAPTGAPVGGQLPTAAAGPSSLGVSPQLKYEGANDLFQDVALLNQEVDNVANRACYVPYVVKLKLAVIINRPTLPYSAHTRVSFFLKDPPREVTLARDVKPARDVKLAQPEPVVNPWCLRAAWKPPVVVPFLVADDMEAALKSRTAEAAQQISFALSGTVHGVGVNGALDNLRQTLKAISDQELSSTVTVGRETENTLYVRIAPNNVASGDPSLVGRNYDVAVLLLVPILDFQSYPGVKPTTHAPNINFQHGPVISLVAQTVFRGSYDGTVLHQTPWTAYVGEFDRMIPKYMNQRCRLIWQHLDSTKKYDDLIELIGDVQDNNLGDPTSLSEAGGFYNHIKYIASPPLDPNMPCLRADWATYLWADVARLIDLSNFKTAMFQVPAPTPLEVPTQDVLIVDDGTHPTQAMLYGVVGQSASQLAAKLEFSTPDGTAVTLPAQTLGMNPVAHVLTLTFPSPKKLQVTEADPSQDGKTAAAKPAKKAKGAKAVKAKAAPLPTQAKATVGKIVIWPIPCDSDVQLCPTVKPNPVVLKAHIIEPTKPESTPPGFALGATSGVIVIPRRSSIGSFQVAISKLAAGETAAVTISGGGSPGVSAVDVNGKPLTFGPFGWVLPQNGAYTFILTNLTPGASVSASVQGVKAGVKDPADPIVATYTAVTQ